MVDSKPMIRRSPWPSLARQALGFSVAVVCGGMLVSAVQVSTAHAECLGPPQFEELLHLKKRGVEPLGPADDPGDPAAVDAAWASDGVMRPLFTGLVLAEPWGRGCQFITELP